MSGREHRMSSTAPAPTCPSCGEPPSATGETPTAEPVTHCEWCGAEYPVPEGHRPASGG